MSIRVGISLMPSDDFLEAAAPLVERGIVEAVEWSVDFGFAPASTPVWLEGWLDRYERAGELLAHGVELSPLSAVLGEDQRVWLDALTAATRARRYVHLTEHYGFITAGDAIRGTPLPLPPSARALSMGIERIAMLREAASLPIGLENLAFAFGDDDVMQQADFVRALAEGSDAFVLLDLHNLHCQAESFGIPVDRIATRYPLDRVREIHLAGGTRSRSRVDPARRPFVRDTHDGDVPPAVLALLERIVPACPALSHVVLERSDRTLFGEDEQERYRADFERIGEVVRAASGKERVNVVDVPQKRVLVADDEDDLERYQATLLDALRPHRSPAAAVAALEEINARTPYAGHVARFEPAAVEVAQELAQKWIVKTPPDDTMMAAVLAEVGAPVVLHHLPRVVPGPGQVAIRVTAAGICGTDLHIAAGRLPIPLPIVPGHEYVGVVERVGEGVARIAPGDRVGVGWVQRACGACPSCAIGRSHQCEAPRTWVENGGGLSELAIADASGCVALPPDLADEAAAPLFCAGYVAASALLRARLAPRERVAVLGLGGVGHLALQIARAMGHDVVVVTRTAAKAKDARALGATDTIIDADVGGALAAMGGVDVVIAATNDADVVGAALGGLRQGGRIALVGLADAPLSIDPVTLVGRDASLFGVGFGPRSDLETVLALAATGAVVPRVETYPLLMAHRAFDRLAEGRVRYRAVVTAS